MAETELALARQVALLLQTQTFGRNLKAMHEVNSTNTLALDWAARGAPHGSVVLAEYQHGGRGRMGRTWEAAAGQNLLFSVIIRPEISPSRLHLLTLAASLAVVDALSEVAAPIPVRVKWPNDILLDGRKCCGMLLESSVGKQVVVVLGIGINVNQSSFPSDLEALANSLILASGRPVDRAALLADILLRLECRLDQLECDDEAIRQTYAQHLSGRKSFWRIRSGSRHMQVSGKLLGITKDGTLRLQTPDGLITVNAGELTQDAVGD